MTASTVPERAPNAALGAAAILAFDTSTERLVVAVRTASGVSVTRTSDGGSAASVSMLPTVDALLAEAGIGYRDLDAIAFGRGPGAFTGLRTACAVAQGLGFGLALPLLPIDSLLVVADDARCQVALDADAFDVTVAMDARMEEVYTGRYRWSNGCWSVVAPPALVPLAAVGARWSGDGDDAEGLLGVGDAVGSGGVGDAVGSGGVGDAVAGSALAAFGDRLPVPSEATRVDAEFDRAAALLRLAVAAAAAGAGVDPAQALPIYLRDRVALTTVERDAARAAAAAR